MHQLIGKFMMGAGIFLVIAGILVYFLGDKLKWFGHLPGDIYIKRDNLQVFFPITTMILLSILISLVVFIVKKFF
ncbi:MAG: DUF2905 domain-containing protein [Bacteroidota bacterium]|nr:DUF2905 domain-containing protein [Bacteroidota bacterium]MDP4227388.1 DUF2905 domain-containing protein [Bacteroidota bacterium]MDP4274235.1 DUF2905 domain-containing protein [Bacteroidota bacterium]